METHKIIIDGQDLSSDYTIKDGFFCIPAEKVFKNDPVKGIVAIGYYCSKQKGLKKWKVQIKTKKLANLLGISTHLIYLEKREEVEYYIKSIDWEIIN